MSAPDRSVLGVRYGGGGALLLDLKPYAPTDNPDPTLPDTPTREIMKDNPSI